MDNNINNEIVILNLLNASNIITKKKLWKNTNNTKQIKNLFESYIGYDPKTNFNESQLFASDNNFKSIMTSNNIDLLLESNTLNPYLIPFRNNNIFAYLNKLNENLLIGSTNGIVKFFESETKSPINLIKTEIKKLLSKLSKDNDIFNYSNKQIINTKIITGNLNVFGFNLFDINNFAEFVGRKINSIIYDNNNSNVLVQVDDHIYTYDIESDEINEYMVNYFTSDNVLFNTKEIKSTESLFTKLKMVLNSDFTVLYINNDYYNDKPSFNNLYNDQKFTALLKANNAEKQKSKTSGAFRGYLVK